MTTAVARPTTAPRPVRGRPGRRALHVVLFLGALLALGLLFGARAHAEERQEERQPVGQALDAAVDADLGADVDTGSGGDVSASVRDPAPGSARKAPVAPPRKTVRQAPRPTGQATQPVRQAPRPIGQATQPVRQAPRPIGQAPRPIGQAPHPIGQATHPVRQVTHSIGQVTHPVRRVAEKAEKAVGSAVTRVRDGATRLPGQWPVPVKPLPDAPKTPSAQPHPAPAAHADDGRAGSGPRGGPRSAPAPAPVHRTTGVPAGPATSRATTAAPQRQTATEHRSGRRGPLGPSGDQGRSAPAEAHPPRGGDLHAVASFAARTSRGLIRGAGLPATVAPVRDRSGDILEFPG